MDVCFRLWIQIWPDQKTSIDVHRRPDLRSHHLKAAKLADVEQLNITLDSQLGISLKPWSQRAILRLIQKRVQKRFVLPNESTEVDRSRPKYPNQRLLTSADRCRIKSMPRPWSGSALLAAMAAHAPLWQDSSPGQEGNSATTKLYWAAKFSYPKNS